MDIEKLIEQLRTESLYADKASLEIMDLCMDAATVLSTLQAENEKMQEELARVTAERDAAVSDIETALAYGVENCELCANSQCHLRGGTKLCLPKWRGIKED